MANDDTYYQVFRADPGDAAINWRAECANQTSRRTRPEKFYHFRDTTTAP